MSRRATLVDVARAAGVDKAIVSRLVNGDTKLSIRAETRARVEAAIIELKYVPNATARTLRTARPRTYGLLIPDFANPVYSEIIIGAEEAAAVRGYLLMTASTTTYSGSGKGDSSPLDLLTQDRIEGLLIAGNMPQPGELEQLTARGLPWLTVNNRLEDPRRWVALDDEHGAHRATMHLIELGHRRIAHIAGPEGAETALRRLAGYRRALDESGIKSGDELIAHAEYSPRGGADAVNRLLRHGPTGYFAANATAAVGALGRLTQEGVRIPDDVSVVAMHDHALAEFLVPSLTTVRMPLRDLGRRAVALLFESAPTDEIAETVQGGGVLVQRCSSAPPPA